MAYQTTSTFGVVPKVLTMGDPIFFASTARTFFGAVLDCGDTGPTVIEYVDPEADPPGQKYDLGGADVIPYDNTATGPGNLAAGKWCLRKAPPLAG